MVQNFSANLKDHQCHHIFHRLEYVNKKRFIDTISIEMNKTTARKSEGPWMVEVVDSSEATLEAPVSEQCENNKRAYKKSTCEQGKNGRGGGLEARCA